MKHKHNFLEEIEVPEIPMEDIMETINVSKQLVKCSSASKLETRTYKQVFAVLRHHFPQLLGVEVAVCIIACMITLVLSSDNIQFYQDTHYSTSSVPLLCFLTILAGSMILSITTAVELLRSRLSATWEIETSCVIRLEIIISFKLFLMSIITFLGLGVMAYLLSLTQQEVSGLTIFTVGVLPYLIITSCMVQGSRLIHSVQEVIAVFVTFTALYIGMLLLCSQQLVLLPISSMLGIVTISVLACFSFHAYTLLKQS